MSVVQSTYSEAISDAVAGMPANADFSAYSKVCETAAGIGFGVVVGKGSADNGAVIGASAAANFLGIAVRDRTLLIASGETADQYQQNDVMGVMYRGLIWVPVGAAVNDGDDVTFVNSTGVLSSTATGGTQFAIAGARWMTTQATVNGLALLHLGGALPSS